MVRSSFYILMRIFRLQSLLVALLLLCATSGVVNAKAKDQETDKINNKLRTVNAKGEMDDYRASIAEVLVTKNEAKALQQLNKLLGKYKNTPLEAGLLFRKAELYVRQSKSARFFEFNRDDKILTLLPKTVKIGSSLSKLREAVNIYEQIERRYPNYSELDLVLFNNAFIRQQLDQEKLAEKIYRNLLQRYPESYLVPDTYMSLAEMLYKNKRFQDSLKEYEAIKNYPLARVYTYALYKTGWTKYQLKDVDGAVKELESVIKVSEQNLISENGNKISLKSEALTDLVLFYPEAYKAKDAFAYFRKLAGDEAGKYIISLSQLYESHSNYPEFEVVLNDLISDMPKSPQAPVAYKSLIEADLVLKVYEKAAKHIASFEKHCRSNFEHEYKSVDSLTANSKNSKKDAKKDAAEEDEVVVSCPGLLSKQSLKLAARWHKEWQSKKKKIQEATAKVNKKDTAYLDSIADATELSYQIYLRNTLTDPKIETVRFSYAELLFARKKFRESSEQYYQVSLAIKDEKILHEASYYAIVSLESAVGEKWSDKDEDQYLMLSKNYIFRNPKGKFVNDITFKRSFIAYEKARYDEALGGFKKLGWDKTIDVKISSKSQDLYLDILNIQKKYEDIMNASHSLLSTTSDDRKDKLEKVYRESFFAYTLELQNKQELDQATVLYEKFYKENSKSNLADKALWNLTQIYIKQNKLSLAADKSYEFFKTYPKSEHAKKALEKSAELYEFLGQTNNVAIVASDLARVDGKNSDKWNRISADFNLVSGDSSLAVSKYKEILKNPDSKARSDIVGKLKRIASPNKDVMALILKYDLNGGYFEKMQRAKNHFESKNYTAAFKVSSELVGEKDAPNDYQAEARFIQAEILASEFFQQSMKTKVERLEMVLTLKTEKLDKAQRAYQSAIRYGIPEVSGKAYLRLSKIYSHYVDALKNINITEDIPEKDKQILMGEIEKISMPIEEKIADTLMQGIDFVKKYPAYDDVGFELRNELSRINFKGTKYVKYNMQAPKVALPEVN